MGKTVASAQGNTDDLAGTTDTAGLDSDIAEFKAWLTRQMLIFLCILILIATIAVAASKAIP